MTVPTPPAPAPGARSALSTIDGLLSVAAALLLIPAWLWGLPSLLILVAVVAAAAVAPRAAIAALGALCAIAPAAAAGIFGWPVRVAEILPAAVLCGVFGHACLRRDLRAPAAARWAAGGFATAIVASIAVQAALTRVVLSPGAFDIAAHDFFLSFYSESHAFDYAIAGARLLVGLGLFVAAAAAVRRPHETRRTIRMLLAGAGGLACLNLARLGDAALRTGEGWPALAHALAHVRISGPDGDPNATGSFFVLMLPMAIALAVSARRHARGGYVVLAALLGAGLWMSGSRAALGAIALVLSAVWAGRLRRPGHPRRTAALAAAAILTAALLVSVFPNRVFDRQRTVGAAGIRAEMARVSFRMWRTDPWFGIGVGRFWERSAEFITDPYVRTLYNRENAHNYFLQVLAELGVVGAAGFALVLVVSLRGHEPFGLRAGLAAFLLTCLLGHPLLLPDAAWAFWLVAGLAVGQYPPDPPGRALRIRRASLALMAIVLIGIPWAFKTERAHLNLEHLGYGVSAWQTSPDGHKYRRSEGDATIFVPRYASVLVMSVRPADAAVLPITLSLTLDGRPADRLVLPIDAWRVYRLSMPHTAETSFAALRIRAEDAAGRPAGFLVEKIEALAR